MSWFDHAFEAPIERHGVGRERQIWYNVLFLPDELAAELPFDRHPQLRIEGEIADIAVANAFIPAGDGRYYVIVSPQVMTDAALRLGEMVEMRFRVADQAAVDTPKELQSAIESDANTLAAWTALTVGRRRGLAHHVASAKTASTRQRRVAAVCAAITGVIGPGVSEADVTRLDYLLGKGRRAKSRP